MQLILSLLIWLTLVVIAVILNNIDGNIVETINKGLLKPKDKEDKATITEK